MALTNDADRARATIQEQFAGYGDVPTYSRMLELEGATRVVDIAAVGDDKVHEGFLDRLRSIGVTDVMASLAATDDDAVERTTSFLASQL